MLYDVRLQIAADYPVGVKEARHMLRMRLRASRDQDVLRQDLTVSPKPDETHRAADFFGNHCDHIAILHRHDTLEADLSARIRVSRQIPDLSGSPSREAVAASALGYRDTGGSSPIHFRGASRLIVPSAASRAFARDFASLNDAAGLALNMTKAIFEGFTYASGETGIDTPVDEVLRSRRGVCQDFAHLMILALRGLGLPAAYVSGFLRTDPPPGRPRLAGADAMHAWVAVWLGEALGWVQFDPTNGVAAGNDHLVAAFGRDYADVAPMGGVVTTSGGQAARHAVDVVPVAEEAAHRATLP